METRPEGNIFVYILVFNSLILFKLTISIKSLDFQRLASLPYHLLFTMPKNGFHPIELRIQILGLVAWGVDAKDIATKLEVPLRSIQKMIQRVKDRGFNPGSCERVRMEYAEDAKRSGRPKEITPEKENAIIQSITKDRNGREKSLEILAYEAGISHSSVLRILKRNGFIVAKPSWKPRLTEAAKAKQLKFCLDHQHWTLDDWKNII
jgi:transposase